MDGELSTRPGKEPEIVPPRAMLTWTWLEVFWIVFIAVSSLLLWRQVSLQLESQASVDKAIPGPRCGFERASLLLEQARAESNSLAAELARERLALERLHSNLATLLSRNPGLWGAPLLAVPVSPQAQGRFLDTQQQLGVLEDYIPKLELRWKSSLDRVDRLSLHLKEVETSTERRAKLSRSALRQSVQRRSIFWGAIGLAILWLVALAVFRSKANEPPLSVRPWRVLIPASILVAITVGLQMLDSLSGILAAILLVGGVMTFLMYSRAPHQQDQRTHDD